MIKKNLSLVFALLLVLTVLPGHALAETMLVVSLPVVGLVSSFHAMLVLFVCSFVHLACKCSEFFRNVQSFAGLNSMIFPSSAVGRHCGHPAEPAAVSILRPRAWAGMP